MHVFIGNFTSFVIQVHLQYVLYIYTYYTLLYIYTYIYMNVDLQRLSIKRLKGFLIHNWNAFQVNDSFSHEKRDVMELINSLLSGQVHPRDVPLIRVAWHLGFRKKIWRFQIFCRAVWVHEWLMHFVGMEWGDLFKWSFFFHGCENIGVFW